MEDSHRTINTNPPTQLGRVEPQNGSLARYTLTADDEAWTIRTNFTDIN